MSMRIGDSNLDNIDLVIRANGMIKMTDNGSSLNYRITIMIYSRVRGIAPD